jgi:serine/threonine protein kinase
LFNFGVVKISDFGWAVYSGMGMRKTASGSPLYYPPEIVKGELYDDKIDVWNIGMMTYECILGKTPFRVYSELDLGRIVTNWEYIGLRRYFIPLVRGCDGGCEGLHPADDEEGRGGEDGDPTDVAAPVYNQAPRSEYQSVDIGGVQASIGMIFFIRCYKSQDGRCGICLC